MQSKKKKKRVPILIWGESGCACQDKEGNVGAACRRTKMDQPIGVVSKSMQTSIVR